MNSSRLQYDGKARRIELVVFDMEGTLTTHPTLWELMHQRVGTWNSHGLPYWEMFKAGKIEYDEFARLDVSTWKGASEQLLDEAVREVPTMPGCAELMRFLAERDIRTAIVTNGLERLALRLARELGIARIAANREVVRDGRLTGELDLRVPFRGKGEAFRQIACEMGVPLDRTAAVGDGPADVAMFRQAGLAIAFAPSREDACEAAHHVVRQEDLRLLVPLLA